jgi:hypothetical protein
MNGYWQSLLQLDETPQSCRVSFLDVKRRRLWATSGDTGMAVSRKPDDERAEEIRRFELAAWQLARAQYERRFGRATAAFVPALLDAAGVGSEMRVLEISNCSVEDRYRGANPGSSTVCWMRKQWYRLPGSNGGPPDPQSGALTN